MRDNITLALAVFGSAVGLWNFWKTHWGATPKYGITVEHRGGAKFVIRNTGRRDWTARSPMFLPEPSLSDLPKLFELHRGEPVPFSLEPMHDGRYPSALRVLVHGKFGKAVTADVPFSPEAQEAVQRKQ